MTLRTSTTGMTRGRMVSTIVASVSPSAVVADYVSRVNAQGGTVSTNTQNSLVVFVTSLVNSGDWTKIDRINMFASDTFTGMLVPLKVGSGSSLDVNTGFISTDYTLASGLTGKAASMLSTGVAITPTTIGPNPSSNFMMGVMVLASPTSGNLGIIGGSYTPTGNTDRFYMFPFVVGVGNVGFTPVTGASPFVAGGLWSVEMLGTTIVNSYSNGVLIYNTNLWNGQGPQAGTLTVMSIGGTGFPATGVRAGGYLEGQNLNEAAVNTAFTTFNTSIGRS